MLATSTGNIKQQYGHWNSLALAVILGGGGTSNEPCSGAAVMAVDTLDSASPGRKLRSSKAVAIVSDKRALFPSCPKTGLGLGRISRDIDSPSSPFRGVSTRGPSPGLDSVTLSKIRLLDPRLSFCWCRCRYRNCLLRRALAYPKRWHNS